MLLEIEHDCRESNLFSAPPLNIMLVILLHGTSHEVHKVGDNIVPRSKTRIIFIPQNVGLEYMRSRICLSQVAADMIS